MKQQLTDQVKFLHKVVIIKTEQEQKRALILKRASDANSRPGAWDLPGGNAEWPKQERDSAANLHQIDIAREVKEESNLLINPELFDIDHLLYFSSYFEADRQIYTVICGWGLAFSETDQAAIKISTEHQDQAWIYQEEIDNYDFAGERGEFIKDILKKAFSKISKK